MDNLGLKAAERIAARRLAEIALSEDLLPLGDLSASIVPNRPMDAAIVARSSGVLSGTVCVEEVAAQLGATVDVRWNIADGDSFAAGFEVGRLLGDSATVLMAERASLNFLSYLSGIATETSRWVSVADGRVGVWDTRKTLPGYRTLAKAAVRHGGGSNHRGNLSDWVMIKDNHLAVTSIPEAVAEARSKWPGRVVHVEVESLGQAVEAALAGAGALLLDNFSPQELGEVVSKLRQSIEGQVPLLEASGGITFDTLDAYAKTEVDYVSSGALTNSAHPIDFGLDV